MLQKTWININTTVLRPITSKSYSQAHGGVEGCQIVLGLDGHPNAEMVAEEKRPPQRELLTTMQFIHPVGGTLIVVESIFEGEKFCLKD